MADIFEFFQKNEQKLHEKPPEQVWQKLEQKLEHSPRPKRRRGIQFLQIWVVVLIFLILILASVLVWHYTRSLR
jgi:hypothetical protein